jgi:threonine/homoserine/homoserine lactone efflux protein
MELVSSYANTIFVLAAIHLSGAISPGPSTVLVAQTSALLSRQAGLRASLAMGFGALFWASIALFGLQFIFLTNSYVFFAFKIWGALFLIWTGIQMARNSSSTNSYENLITHENVFFTSLKFQLSNPKVAVFFGSVYLTVLPSDIPIWLKITILLIIFINETLWYSILAYGFSYNKIQTLYESHKRWLGLACGIFILVIGISLLKDAFL